VDAVRNELTPKEKGATVIKKKKIVEFFVCFVIKLSGTHGVRNKTRVEVVEKRNLGIGTVIKNCPNRTVIKKGSKKLRNRGKAYYYY
jgi:hypothetical protein